MAAGAGNTIQQFLDQAIRCHQTGQLAEAEAIYRQIAAVRPRDAKVLHLLGSLLHQKGQRAEGLDLLRRAIDLEPGAALCHLNFANALARDARTQEAFVATRTSLALSPDSAEAHFAVGRLHEACECHDDALEAYRQAIALNPNFASAYNNLGNTLHSLGRFEEAEAAFRKSLYVRPSDSKTHKNLARALHELGRLDEASARYRHALSLDPRDPEIHNNLGRVLASGRQFEQAIVEYQHALALGASNTSAMTNLGNALIEVGRPDEGIEWFRRAINAGVDAHAGSCLNRAIQLHPGYDARAIEREHQAWEQRFARPLAPLSIFFPNNRDPGRRLRIGYVSPQFGDHFVGHCMASLLSSHDHDAFEIICYSDTRRPDWMTARIRPCADLWRNVVGLSDDQLTAQIRKDRIDILVDLAQHTEGNRLRVFARKLAPIQMTWGAYPGTTGLQTIDYRLSDPYVDPPAANGAGDAHEHPYSERTIRLPNSYLCYQPPDGLPQANPLPALQNGYVTFGCLDNFSKVSDLALQLWARVLAAVPNSKLLLLAPAGAARDRVSEVFAQEGIDRARIGFLDHAPRRQRMELYQQLDLCVDTVPYAGDATTLDSLWMGVPVVSLAGNTAVSRSGLSILSNVGLPELCSRSSKELVDTAVALAGNLGRLTELRATLRERMQKSPLMDGSRFARDVEAAYRGAWKEWCSSTDVSQTELATNVTVGKTPYRIVVLEPPGHVWSAGLHELARLLELSLTELGYPASVETNVFSASAINIVLGYYLMKEPVDAYWIPYQLEQLEVEGRRSEPFLKILSSAPQIWDYDPTNIAFLRAQGIDTAIHVPIGFHAGLRTIAQRPADIDVLHYGFASERRGRLLRALAHRCRVENVASSWGAARDELISRSKIVLNVHSFEAPIFEQVRVSHLLNNGRCVVTEDSPYNPYREMAVTTTYDRIVDRCIELLSNDAERERLAREGSRRFEAMTMTVLLARAISDRREQKVC